MDTVWVFGDQLSVDIKSLAGRDPATTTVLLVESGATIGDRPWHRQRLHVVLAGMRRFAGELETAGFTVDLRPAPTFATGLRAHRERFSPDRVVAMEPMSWSGQTMLERLDVDIVGSNQFLCHRDDFAAWAAERDGRLRMEDFYRWQRQRLDVLMDGDAPEGGRWNYDDQNREPPPDGDPGWPEPVVDDLDDLDAAVLAGLPPSAVGADPTGIWPTDRAGALRRLERFIAHGLPRFGPHQDAMTESSWHLAHSLISPALNLGVLHPREVVDAAVDAYDRGEAPLASVEGFVRQIIGWREYVWGLYWLWMPGYRDVNELDADRPLPPMFVTGDTEMRCMSETLAGVEVHGYAHHIQRLMILSNFALIAGLDPQAFNAWMRERFVDAAEWVMLPNVLGMGLHADGGRMATKPYAASGAYIDRMSDHCAGCVYDRRARVGDNACPFTTLYWDFLARNEASLQGNGRMGRQLANLRRLSDIDDVRARAVEILGLAGDGSL
ncbi:MAG: cryptochrome/photolyase family protein [Acidimicrobiales bacterium]